VGNPLRSEAEAFRFTVALAALALAAGLAAWLGGAWVGLGVFLALVLGVGLYLRRRPPQGEPAIWERPSKPQ